MLESQPRGGKPKKIHGACRLASVAYLESSRPKRGPALKEMDGTLRMTPKTVLCPPYYTHKTRTTKPKLGVCTPGLTLRSMENGGHDSLLVILVPAPKESLKQGTRVPNGVVPFCAIVCQCPDL